MNLFATSPYENAGISDAAMGFRLGEILEEVAPRTLVILRPLDQIAQSMTAVGLGDPTLYCEYLIERLKPHLSHPLVRCLSFDSLRDNNIVRDCLDHLLPGTEADATKIGLMQGLNVQADVHSVLEGIMRRGREATEQALGTDIVQEIERRRDATLRTHSTRH